MRILLKTPLEGRPALAVTAFCPGIASSEQYTDFFPPSEAHWLFTAWHAQVFAYNLFYFSLTK